MAQVISQENLGNLIINHIPSKTIYQEMATQGLINENELYMVDGTIVDPVAKTALMTQPVGVDGSGRLYTAPGSGGGDAAGVVAPAYSDESIYNAGDLVIYEQLLYVATENITAPEAWTPAHWEQTMINAELKQYVKYGTLVVTCLTQDGVTVTGQTVTARKGVDSSGAIYAQATYNGQPVSFSLPHGFDYYVSVSDTLASHFNPTTASGIMNTGTINVTLTYSDSSNIKTFKDVKAALNSGIDLTELVGEQVTATRNSTSLVFDVADYNSTTKSVMLLLHDTLSTQMQVEPEQALMWCENGLSAGAYSFINGSSTYYFTLNTAIPENGQLVATTSTFSTYESNDTTIKLETGSVSTTSISGATSLGTTASGLLNHMDRVNYGSNNIGESGLFAWLNSDAEQNTNLPRINKFSRPYSTGSQGGFLYGFDSEDLACIDETEWRVNANNVYEAPAALGGITTKGGQYTATGKFGLANPTNIGLEGSSPWQLYKNATNPDRIKYYNGSARYWWLMAPYPSIASRVRRVDTGGSLNNFSASSSSGVVPACKISKTTEG